MPQVLQWGRKTLHPKYGTEHFLVVGASGSGKTTLINMMLKSVFEGRRPFRAMIYDPKQEVIPYLFSLLETEPQRVKVLDPFDIRSCAWNLAQDIDGPVSARQFATILSPDTQGGSGSDSFFTNAVRDLLTGVILTYIQCVPNPGVWTFRDVILTMLYEPYLRFILEINQTRYGEPFPVTARLREAYLAGDPQKSDPRTASNIRATINTALSIYEPIAAVWHLAQQAGNTFALSQWVRSACRDVLVLGNDEASRAAFDAINQAIFKRTTELLLARREATQQERENGDNQTWFFLDEVREAGELDGLSRLLTKGRSKGACIVLGFQDIDGMRAAYGEEVAQEICGQCNNTAILKLNSPSTAKWAAELFGSRLTTSKSQSSGTGSGKGVNTSRETGEEERPWVYTSDVLYLPVTSPQNGLHGYFRSPDVDPNKYSLRMDLDWNTHIRSFLPQPHPHVVEQALLGRLSMYSARLLRPVSEHYLKPWDTNDWKRLGLDSISPTVIDWHTAMSSAPAPPKPIPSTKLGPIKSP